VLDQFEEYFQYHDEGDGEALTGFAAELADVVNDPGLAAHVLISIREDAWAKLDRFEGHVPLLFANYLRIDQLDHDAAREAIEGPIAAWNARLAPGEAPYDIEPKLMGAVLAAAAAGLALDGNEAVAEASAGDRVEAPFLQLVLERLWRETVADGEHVLTLARLDALGGARKIVENHLLVALAALSAVDQDVASDCFRFLVSRSRTKIAHSAADLAEWTARPEQQVTAVLDRLTSAESGRILRAVAPPLDRPESTSYELFHDVLAEPILAWRHEHERERSRHEAQRKLLRVGGAALALVALFAALAGWAFVERGHANHLFHVANRLFHEQQATSRAIKAQNVTLRHRRDRLAARLQSNTETGNAQNATIDELNATSISLRAQTSKLRTRRNALDGRIATLRSQNRRLFASIARLSEQNRHLAKKVTRVKRRNEALTEQLAELEAARGSLEGNAVTLRTESAALAKQLNAADKKKGKLREQAAALGLFFQQAFEPAATSGPPPLPRIPPAQAKHFGIPADQNETDALRGEVDRLQRKLAILLERRARSADEIGFLRSLNRLLVRQRRVLRLEVAHLSRTRASLESVHHRLERTVASARAEHARLSGLVAAAEATNARRRKAVGAQSGANVRLQDRNNEQIDSIDVTQLDLDSTQADIHKLTYELISPPVNKLTQGAQDTSQDPILAALLAAAAYQVTPFNPDDAKHPAVYNALWLVLSRLDPNGARGLIAPVAQPKGKLGTTTSAVLKKKVCAFVKRGFTRDEWSKWLPERAPYPSKLSKPCA
jgi:septal ring factor EnvC (AmiA/AmiB activator)